MGHWRCAIALACALGLSSVESPAEPPHVVLDGEDGEWSGAIAVQDPKGDSRGPGGSDLLTVSISNDERCVYVMMKVAGIPNVDPASITYNVDFALTSDFYNHRCCFWGDGNGLSGSMLYEWAAKDAAVVSLEAKGARAVAGSVVELQLPFALLGGIFTSAVWVKASTADHATGNPIDEVQFQYLPTASAGGSASKEITIEVDGMASDWDACSALLTDPRGDSAGPEGSDLVRAGIANDAERLYIMLGVDKSPSMDTRRLTYCVDMALKSEEYDARIAVLGDGRHLSGALLHRWVHPDAPPVQSPAVGVRVASEAVVELSIPFSLLGARWREPHWLRVCVLDNATGKRWDEIQVEYTPSGASGAGRLGDALAAAVNSWESPPRISVPSGGKVGHFSEYSVGGGMKERWAMVGEQGGLLLVENRLESPGGRMVHKFLVDADGVVRKAWAGRMGGAGVVRPVHHQGDESGGAFADAARGQVRMLEQSEETVAVAGGTFACTKIRFERVDAKSGQTFDRFTAWFHPSVRFTMQPVPEARAGGVVKSVDADGNPLLELTANGTDAEAELTAE